MENGPPQPNLDTCPPDPTPTSKAEELRNRMADFQTELFEELEDKKALTDKVDELQKELHLAKENERKLRKEMKETKKWVVEELKLLLLNDDKDQVELLKSKLSSAHQATEDAFWKRLKHRDVIKEQRIKINLLEAALKDTESGLREELKLKDDEVEGLRKKVESAEQEKRVVLEKFRGIMEQMEGLLKPTKETENGNTHPNADCVPPSEDENPVEGDDLELGGADAENVSVYIPSGSASKKGQFKCQMCSKRFFHLDVCMKHMKKVHGHGSKSRAKFGSRRPNSSGRVLKIGELAGKQNHFSMTGATKTEQQNHDGDVGGEANEQGPSAGTNIPENVPPIASTSKRKCPEKQTPIEKPMCPDRGYSLRNRRKNLDSHPQPAQPSADNISCTSSVGKNHRRKRAGKRLFDCHYCSKRKFTSKASLTRHINFHLGDRPFSCNSCPKSFYSQAELRNHLTAHSDERPYPCDYCDKAFKLKIQLQRHLVTHTGERPFKCPFCAKDYGIRSYLYTHLQLTHKQPKVLASKLAGSRPYGR